LDIFNAIKQVMIQLVIPHRSVVTLNVGVLLRVARIVTAPLTEQEFGLAKDSLLLLGTFVIACGVAWRCFTVTYLQQS
jgi:hypothetical protein